MQRPLILLSTLFFLTFSSSLAQIGGDGTYGFLNLTMTPRSAALGGKAVALDEADFGIALSNPAHLSSELNSQLALSYVAYYADINYGFVAFAKHYENLGTFGAGVQYVNYGSFIEADEAGQILGSFRANDIALNLMYSYSYDSLINFGVNIKPVFSFLESYTSIGLCADFGVSYLNPEGLFSAGLVARNIGTMLKPYTKETWEPMPFEVVAGFSQKLRHAPFRFVFNFQQLQTYNLYYQRESTTTVFFGEEEETKTSIFEQAGKEFISHLIVGVEFIPVQNFYIRGGYNFQRRNELRVEDLFSAVGFSWGIGVKIKDYYINYSRATYHLVGASNHFSVTTNLEDFFVRKNL